MEGTKIVLDALMSSIRPLLIPVFLLIVFTLVFGVVLLLAEKGTLTRAVNGDTSRVTASGTPSEVTGVFRASWIIIVT